MQAQIGSDPSEDEVRQYLWATLKSGVVIPGYGHAVLRRPDPRYTALMSFAAGRPAIVSNPLFGLVRLTEKIAPEVLTKHQKTKNPFPNVDSVSGMLMHHFGFRDPRFYTVVFGVSRGLGPLAQLIWDRALGMPLERPKSVNLRGLMSMAKL